MYTSGSGKEAVWNLHSFWPFGALPLGPMEATCTNLNNFEFPTLRMILAKFGLNPTMRFQEEDENVKSLRTLDKIGRQ